MPVPEAPGRASALSTTCRLAVAGAPAPIRYKSFGNEWGAATDLDGVATYPHSVGMHASVRPVPSRRLWGKRGISVTQFVDGHEPGSADPPPSAATDRPDTAEVLRATDAMFAEGDRTAPVAIVAPRRVGDTELITYPIALGASRLAATERENAHRILSHFVGRGGTMIDLASHDGGAASEELVGEWIAASHGRERLVVSARLDAGANDPDGRRHDKTAVLVRSVQATLRRLRTDRIELLMLDLRAPGAALEELLSAADSLIARGLVRNLVATGATADQLLEARVLASTGLPRFSAVLANWDLVHRDGFEGDLHIVAAAQGLAILPDATLTSSLLAAPELPLKVLASKLPAILRSSAPASEKPVRAVEVLRRGRPHRIAVALDRVADELGVGPVTASLAWLLAKRNVAAPVVGVTRSAQLDGIMSAAMVRLSRAQMLELDRASE